MPYIFEALHPTEGWKNTHTKAFASREEAELRAELWFLKWGICRSRSIKSPSSHITVFQAPTPRNPQGVIFRIRPIRPGEANS